MQSTPTSIEFGARMDHASSLDMHDVLFGSHMTSEIYLKELRAMNLEINQWRARYQVALDKMKNAVDYLKNSAPKTVIHKMSGIFASCNSSGNFMASQVAEKERRIELLRSEHARVVREHRANMDALLQRLARTKEAMRKLILENQHLRGERNLAPRFESADYGALSDLTGIAVRAEVARVNLDLYVAQKEKVELEDRIDNLRFLCGLAPIPREERGTSPIQHVEEEHARTCKNRKRRVRCVESSDEDLRGDGTTSPQDASYGTMDDMDWLRSPTKKMAGRRLGREDAIRAKAILEKEAQDNTDGRSSTSSWSPTRDLMLRPPSPLDCMDGLFSETCDEPWSPSPTVPADVGAKTPGPVRTQHSSVGHSPSMSAASSAQTPRAVGPPVVLKQFSSYAQTLDTAISPYARRILLPTGRSAAAIVASAPRAVFPPPIPTAGAEKNQRVSHPRPDEGTRVVRQRIQDDGLLSLLDT